MADIKEIKREIKSLKRLKLQCRSGTSERIALHRKIKKLKSQIGNLYIIEPAKEKVINEIIKLEPNITDFIDLKNHSVEALNIHLKKLKERIK